MFPVRTTLCPPTECVPWSARSPPWTPQLTRLVTAPLPESADGLTNRLFEVPYGPPTVVDRGLSDRLETHCQMEGFGYGIWRFDINLTDDSIMPAPFRSSKKISIEKPGNPLATGGNRDNDAINVDKRLARRLEPHEVRIYIGRAVLERDQKRRRTTVYTPRIESHIEERLKAGVIQRGCFVGICVVQ